MILRAYSASTICFGLHARDLEADDAGRQRLDIGVCSFTFGIAASPCLQRVASSWMRAVTRGLPMLLVKTERLGQRPAVLERMEAARRGHTRPGRQAVGRLALHPRLQRRHLERRDDAGVPLPRLGAPPHACRCRAGRTATCGSRRPGSRSRDRLTDSCSTPNPCTPSTHRSTRSASPRFLFTSAARPPCARMGSFTPVDECTQVTATRACADRPPSPCWRRSRPRSPSRARHRASPCARWRPCAARAAAAISCVT